MSDDLNDDARRLVDLARAARTPGEADKLRIAERLALPLAAGGALGAAAAAAKASELAAGAAGAKAASGSLLGGLGLKLTAALGLGAAATALLVAQLRPAAPPSGGLAAPPAITVAAPAPERAHPALPSSRAVEPEVATAPPPVAPFASAKPSLLGPAHAAKSAPELAEEAALLHRAQTAWRAGQSAQALALANQHAQRFPRSQLANERDVLRVLSLCKLGQPQAAKQIGARLLRTAKGSPWYASLAESCAGAKD